MLSIAARTDGESSWTTDGCAFGDCDAPLLARSHHRMKAAFSPPKTPFALRPVAPPDERFLLRLYESTRKHELERCGWDATRREAFIRQQFNARRADYRVRFPGAEESVVMIDGSEAGVWMVWRNPHELRLVNIELLPQHQGQRIGTALIQGLLAEGETSRLPVMLNVRENNLAAQRLYRRIGFDAVERAQGYLTMRVRPPRK